MSETNETPQPTAPAPVSRIVITFPGGPGSAGIKLEMEHVVPAQLYGAAWFIDAYATEVRLFERQAATQPQGVPVPSDVQSVVDAILSGKASPRGRLP